MVPEYIQYSEYIQYPQISDYHTDIGIQEYWEILIFWGFNISEPENTIFSPYL